MFWSGFFGIPTIVANQVRPLGGNVLRELGDKIERIEDLEIPLRPGCQVVTLRVGEGPAGVLLGLVVDTCGR